VRPGLDEVAVDPDQRSLTDGHDAFAGAFAGPDVHHAAAGVDIEDRQPGGFLGAHGRRQERLHDRPVPQPFDGVPVRLSEDALDLLDAEHAPRQQPSGSRQLESGGRVEQHPPLAGQPAEQRRNATRWPTWDRTVNGPPSGLRR
jgi:hypothetical protein